MKIGIGRRCVIPAFSTTLALFALLAVAVSVASACVLQVAADCGKLYVSYSKFPVRGESHIYAMAVDYDANGKLTSIGTPKLDQPVTNREGTFEFIYPAADGTVRRDITFSYVSYKNTETKTVSILVPKCQTTPPATPVETVTPVVPVTPVETATPAQPAVPATPAATPVVPAKPTPKPHLTLDKKALDMSPLVGHAARFTLKVCNTGKGDARNVVLNDDLGDGLTFTARNGGTMDNGSLKWQLGTIKAGTCHSLIGVQTRVDRSAKGDPCNYATVTASNGNTARDSACIAPRQPKRKPKLPGLVTG